MGKSRGLAKARVSRREFDNICVVACLGQCVKRESCASVENLVGACTSTYMWRGLGLNVLFVFVVLMWFTSVSCPVVLDWSVNELQASEGQTNSCRVITDGCVALCSTFSREFRGCSGHARLEELRPDVGSG